MIAASLFALPLHAGQAQRAFQAAPPSVRGCGWLHLLVFVLLCLPFAKLGAGETNAPFREIVLRDQFDHLQWFEAASNTVTIITVADRKGSEQVAAWVKALKDRFGGKLVFLGVADMSAVPALMRGLVRKKFREAYGSTPVLLDWKGEVVKRFSCKAEAVNVLVVDQQGRPLAHVSGPVDDSRLAEVVKALKPLVPELPGKQP